MHLSQADKLSKKSNGVITNVLESVLLTGMRINGAKLIKTAGAANTVANGYGGKLKPKKLFAAAIFGRLNHDLPLSQLRSGQQLG